MASTLRASNLCLTCARNLRRASSVLYLNNSSQMPNTYQIKLTPESPKVPIVNQQNGAFSTSCAHMCNTHQSNVNTTSVIEQAQKRYGNPDHGETKELKCKPKSIVDPGRKPEYMSEYEEYMYDEHRDRSYTESGAVDYSYFIKVIEATKAVNMNITKGAVNVDPNVHAHEAEITESEQENEMDKKDAIGEFQADKHRELKPEHSDSITQVEDRTFGDDIHVMHSTDVHKEELEQESTNISNATAGLNDAGPTGAVGGASSLSVSSAENVITVPKMRKKVYGLKNIKPKYPTKSYTLTPYVNE